MKTLIKKTLLVLMVAFIAVFTLGVTSKVKAAETTLELIPNNTITGDSSTSYVSSDVSFSYENVEFVINNWNPKSLQVRGNQTAQSNLQTGKNFYLRNTTAFSGSIKSITITSSEGSLVAANIYAQASTAAITNQSTSNSTAGTAGTNSVTWTFEGDNKYFAIGMIKGGTSGTTKITSISITYEVEGGAELSKLSVPTATLSEKTVSWNSVAEATAYKVGIFTSADSLTPFKEIETTSTSVNLDFNYQGTFYVRVKTIGDNITYESSDYSDSIGSFENTTINEISISEFLNSDAQTSAPYMWYQLTGVVSNIANSTYGNFTLVDKNDSSVSVYVYGLKESQNATNQTFANLDIEEGDIITLIGYHTKYNGTSQVGGAYFVSKKANYLGNFKALNTLSTFNVSYSSTSQVVEQSKNIDSTLIFSEQTGYTTNAQDLDGVEFSFNDAANTKVVLNGNNASNTPKYYTTGTGARVYANNTIVISCDKSISSVKFVCHTTYTLGGSSNVGSWNSSDQVINIEDSNVKEVIFTSNKTSRIQKIVVSYSTGETESVTKYDYDVNSIAMRFGIELTNELYTNLLEEGTNVSFGVKALKGEYTNETFDFENAKNKVCEVNNNGEVVTFALLLTNVPASDWEQVITAVAYVCIDGVYYYANVKSYSAISLANHYVDNLSSDDAVKAHLGVLEYLADYTA